MAKEFPTRTVLSVTTGRLLTQRSDTGNGIESMYELLGYMTDDSPFTHQLGRFADECKPWLLRWFPKLADVNLTRLDELLKSAPDGESGCEQWLYEEYTRLELPAHLPVEKIPRDDHEHKNPISELVEMRGGNADGIVVVETD